MTQNIRLRLGSPYYDGMEVTVMLKQPLSSADYKTVMDAIDTLTKIINAHMQTQDSDGKN